QGPPTLLWKKDPRGRLLGFSRGGRSAGARRPNPYAANQSSDRRLTAGGLRTLWPAHPVVGHPIGRHDRLNALRNGLPRRRTWTRAKEDGAAQRIRGDGR